jgi:hypothetical protein
VSFLFLLSPSPNPREKKERKLHLKIISNSILSFYLSFEKKKKKKKEWRTRRIATRCCAWSVI